MEYKRLNTPDAKLRSETADGPTVKSARRVLEILEYFAQDARHASVTEAANALAIPQSSASALLSTLTTLGYLRFDEAERRYSPTLRVMLLGTRLQHELFGQGSLVTVMDQLRQRTGQTVLIGIRQGIHIRVIFSLQGKDAQALHFPIGALRPVCPSAVGKMLLSALPDAQALRIARHANSQAISPANQVNIKAWMAEVAQVRQQGWAISFDYPVPNRAALAVALPEMQAQPPMALVVGSQKPVMLANQERFLEELRRACQMLLSDAPARR